MTKIPLVSVIIPNYNHEQYLPKRIESVLNQTFTDFELLLMDDCSTDNSRILLEFYAAKDPRVRLLFNERNSGSTFQQWKKGVDSVRGKFVWIAESDDYAEVGFLAELVPLLESDDKLTLAYSNSNIVDDKDHLKGTTADWKNELFQTEHWSHDFSVEGRKELALYLSQTCTINNASSVLFRRAAIVAAGGVDSSLRYAGDWLMYIKLCMYGSIAYKAKCLSNYRDHVHNASKKSIVDSCQLLERQKCFALMFQSKTLESKAEVEMMAKASQEFLALIYNTLRRRWQPNILVRYTHELMSISKKYCLKIYIDVLSKSFRRQH